MTNQLSPETRRKQLDDEMLELFRHFNFLSGKAILRDKVGRPEWREVAARMGFCEKIIGLPAPIPQVSQGGAIGRNTPLRLIALTRWGGFLPLIGGQPVNLLEALVMRSELADNPSQAAWNSRELSPRVEEAVLPYASYD